MFYPLTHKDAQHREFENTNFRHNQQTQYTTGVIHVLWENEVKEMKTKLSGEP